MLISTCLSTKTEGSVLLKYSSGHKPEAVFIIWFATILPPCLVPAAAATAKSCQSCPTLCDPMDCKLPGSSVDGIFQATILEWVAFPPPGDLAHPGIELGSSALQTNSSPLSHQE